MGIPKIKKCEVCGKKVYGLSERDVDYKMLLHSIKHRKIKNSNNKNIRRKNG